jgi:hypothetical protein
MNWDLELGLAGVWFPILVPVLELFFENSKPTVQVTENRNQNQPKTKTKQH